MANPITLADAQTHLRLGSLDAAETIELERMITAATEHASAFCNQPFGTADIVTYCDSFPAHAGAPLVVHTKTNSVPTVTYYDTEGTQQTATGLRSVPSGGRTKIYPAFSADWPTDCINEPGSVTLTATADVSDVPAAVQAAILLIVGDLYENREQSVTGQGISHVQMSLTAARLLTPYKTRLA